VSVNALGTSGLVMTPGVAGRVVYSMELLGRPFPDGPWALSKTF
jgi:citronellol/citronellal dehydrogenase